ncbi:hypothetical protein BDY21DRAFT_84323 [Lineolata rhizophorae]|uniref:Uncharacterized protein n=1 Tax=Lineolata rhizophorae TaxID=578093 RepID=A0A6A6PBN5_9PEZI|nr:hypothetical protein BDY21DRAFT_84323 [Lineolata rhizophorae]
MTYLYNSSNSIHEILPPDHTQNSHHHSRPPSKRTIHLPSPSRRRLTRIPTSTPWRSHSSRRTRAPVSCSHSAATARWRRGTPPTTPIIAPVTGPSCRWWRRRRPPAIPYRATTAGKLAPPRRWAGADAAAPNAAHTRARATAGAPAATTRRRQRGVAALAGAIGRLRRRSVAATAPARRRRRRARIYTWGPTAAIAAAGPTAGPKGRRRTRIRATRSAVATRSRRRTARY